MSFFVHYLRAVAALLVVVHHAELYLVSKGLVSQAVLAWGAWGVDVFFVISGFVMVRSVEFSRRIGAGEFVFRRAVRIFPLYWLVTLALATVLLVRPQLLPNANYSAEEIVKSFLLIPYLNTNGDFRPLISQGWTLSFELFFYGLVSIFIVTRARRPVVSAAVALLCIVPLYGFVSSHVHMGEVAAFLLAPIALEFALGVGIAYLAAAFRPPPSGIAVRTLLVAVAFVSVWASARYAVEGTGWDRAIHWGLPAASLVLSLVLLERCLGHVRARAIPSALGDASYAIYLVHGLAFSVFYKLLGRFVLDPLATGVLLTTFAMLSGVAAHFLIEAPLQRGLLRFVKRAGPLPRQAT